MTGSPDISPIPWMITLPSIVAANYERQGKLTDANMQPVLDYTRGEYAEDLIKGNSDPAATPRHGQEGDRTHRAGPYLRAAIWRTAGNAGVSA